MTAHPQITADPLAREARVEYRRDYISGFDHRLLLTGPSVGGYGVLHDSFGGKFLNQDDARIAGAVFIATGKLPAFQTDEDRADIIRQSEQHHHSRRTA